MKLLSHVQLFVIPWTIAYQVPPSMEFSRQEYWRGLPFPSPVDLHNPGLNPGVLHWRQKLYCLSHQASPKSKNPKVNAQGASKIVKWWRNIYEDESIQIFMEYLLSTKTSSRYLGYSNDKDPFWSDVCLLVRREGEPVDWYRSLVSIWTIKGELYSNDIIYR